MRNPTRRHYAEWRGFGAGCTPYDPSTACNRDSVLVDVTRHKPDVTCAQCLRVLKREANAAREPLP